MGRILKKINPLWGERLKKILDDHKMSQKQFATLLHYTEQHISGLVRSKRILTDECARRIIKLFPLTRYEWLMGEDDAETFQEVSKEKIENLSLDLLKIIDIDSFVESFVVISAPACGYIFENKNEDLEYDTLKRKRIDHVLEGLLESNGSTEKDVSLNYSPLSEEQVDRISDLLDFPEEYNIIQNSEIVATCSSRDLEKMSIKIREYLGYLIFKYVEIYRKKQKDSLS